MIDSAPIHTMTDTELEAWFAEAGLAVTIVNRCPDATCPECAGRALADAA